MKKFVFFSIFLIATLFSYAQGNNIVIKYEGERVSNTAELSCKYSETYEGNIGTVTFELPESIHTFSLAKWAQMFNVMLFDEGQHIFSITLPKSITQIDDEGFKYSPFETITLPENLQSIGSSAFEGCTYLTSINFPEKLQTIGNNAFFECENLTSIIFPESLQAIGECAFYNCINLSSITLPGNLRSVKSGAFSGCENLATIALSAKFSPKQWKETADIIGLVEISGLENILVPEDNLCFTSIDGVLFDKNLTILYAFPSCKTNKAYCIPVTVTTISDKAFRRCKHIDSITLPDNLKELGWYAFSGCASLTSLNIPNGVTSINFGTFEDCSSLNSISIPDGVTSIAPRAFYGCSLLTSVSINGSEYKLEDIMEGFSISD